MDKLDWNHGNISRHTAEALLMANGREGSFLLRDVTEGHCLSVRGRDAVKHFKIEQTAEGILFAHSLFDNLDQLLQMLANQVILCGQTGDLSKNFDQGTLLTLKYPYPRQVEEPDNYDEIMMLHSTIRENATLDDLKEQMNVVPLASKSGFLTKQGGSIKSWKTRWFVLVRNEFSYYIDRSSEKPIRTLDIEECVKLDFCDIPGKENCFYLVFPDRTWYFSAKSDDDLKEWTSIIEWKMKQNLQKLTEKTKRRQEYNRTQIGTL